MQFSGNLQDVSIIDVLQIIGMTGKSGALSVVHAEQTAEIGFHRGRIAAARLSPSQGFMTSLLIQRGQLQFDALHRALGIQRQEPTRRPIGAILVELGAVTLEQLQAALRSYIQSIINLVASWTDGEFSFQLGSTESGDTLGLLPSELSLGLDISPQELLLEAARIHDERGHRAAQRSRPITEEDVSLAALGRDPDDPALRPAVVVVTADLLLQHGLEGQLRNGARLVSLSSTGQVEATLRTLRRGSEAPVTVLVDLDLGRDGGVRGPSPLAAVPAWREHHPGLVICTTGANADPPLHALLAGGDVRAHVPKPALEDAAALEVMLQFVDALERVLRPVPPAPPAVAEGEEMKALYDAILELRRSDHSTTVSLEVLRHVARTMERAVLFVVQGDEIIALGIFGVAGVEESQWPASLAKYRTRVVPGSAVEAVIRDRTLIGCAPASCDDTLTLLHHAIGAPRRDEAVLFPLVVNGRTFALIYADNGDVDRELAGCAQLGIMTEHVSLHLENLLLRRQRRLPPGPPRPSTEPGPTTGETPGGGTP